MAPLRLPFLRPRSRLAGACRQQARGRCGLEIGGPSRIFSAKGRVPLYGALASLDGVDFQATTTWSGPRGSEGRYTYPAASSPGRLHLVEGAGLEGVSDAAYDLVLASHVIEHLADPLTALAAWKRVTSEAGHLVLVVPHRDGTFDHRRPLTTLEHLREDRARGVSEDDLTHLDEILRLHDLARDPGAGDRASFEQRARDNARRRTLHHHVFDTELVVRMLDEAGYGVEGVDVMRPYHIVVLARMRGTGGTARCLAPDARWRRHSPFASDRP